MMDHVEDIYELSPTQHGMLVHTLAAPDSEVYVVQLCYGLKGQFDFTALKQAWAKVMQRHPILRSAFFWEELDKPIQVVYREAELPLAWHDWRGLGAEAQQERLEAFLTADRRQGFVLSEAPLMRIALIQQADDAYQLVWTQHHLLLDGWSLATVLKELLLCYEAYSQGQQPRLPYSRSFGDYIAWLQEQDQTALERFWRERLKGFTAPTRLRVELPDAQAEREVREAHHQLTPEATAALQAFARQHGLTLNTLVQGAWAILLGRYSGEADVLFGATVSGRPAHLPGVESIVGMLINTLPVRATVRPDVDLVGWLRELQAQQAQIRQYEFSPLAQVQGWSEVPRGTPLFDTVLVFENFPMDASLGDWSGRLGVRDIRATVRTNYPLTLVVDPGQALALRMEYEAGRYADATIQRLLGHLATLLTGMSAGGVGLVGDLPMLARGERLDLEPAPAQPASAPNRPEPAYAAPQGAVEEQLAAIWADVLGVAQVGVHDNFFELGGDSILGIQMIARANRAGLKLRPGQLFEHPTVAALAGVVGAAAPAAAQAGPTAGVAPLLPIQQQFFAQELLQRQHYNQAFLLDLLEPAGGDQIEAVLRALVLHHDALRLRYRQEGGAWIQEYADLADECLCAVVDLSHLPANGQAEALETAATQAQAGFDLSRGPLLRAVLFQRGPHRPDSLLLIVHHLAVDGISWRILVEDLQAAWRQMAAGQPVALPPRTTSYQEWAQRLQAHAGSPSLQAEADYWLRMGEHPAVTLPVDRPGGANEEKNARTVSRWLSADETRALLQEVPRAYQTQITEILLAALALAFAPWTGERLLPVTLEGHGREDLFDGVDLSRTVGWFTTTYPVTLDLESAWEPADVIRTVKEQLRQVPQKGIGWGLLRWLSPSAELRQRLAALPEPQVVFNYLGQFDQALAEASGFGLSEEPIGPSRSLTGSRTHLLSVDGLVRGGRMQLLITYSDQFHDASTIEQLADGYLTELRGLMAHCLSPEAGGFTPSDFPLADMAQGELDQILAKVRKGKGE